MNRFIDELQQRKLIQQCSNLEILSKYVEQGPLSFYLGIDPTAPSLHCGHLLPVLLAKRLALAGHQALLLIGSGTAKIGDPSGKTEMRKMLGKEEIQANAQAIRRQLEPIFADCEKQPIWLDNANWLDGLNYIEFLCDIGCHFSVNRMLNFESYKQRLERGLSFIEFNYQLLQAYDYLKLFQEHGCLLQIGGDDQWGNMVSGIDLIRRYSFLQGSEAEEHLLPQALTVPLVLNSSGKKMGKTEQGAIFIDPKLTPPFDFFQYWRNCSDTDVEKFLQLFTFLSLARIRKLGCQNGAALNQAKEVLAYELCQSIHGKEAADEAMNTATATTGKAGFDTARLLGGPLSSSRLAELEQGGIAIMDLYIEAGLCTSRNEARRLIQGGGASLNGQKIKDIEQKVYAADVRYTGDLKEGQLLLTAGKKRLYCFRVCPVA